MRALSIGRLAKLAEVSIDTIRFYEKAGLLAPHVRRPSGFREYSELDLKQLRFIRRGRQLGFSLEEIGELLGLESRQDSAISVVQQQLRAIDRKVDELKRWRNCLAEFLEAPATAEPGRSSILDSFADGVPNTEKSAFGPRVPPESVKRL